MTEKKLMKENFENINKVVNTWFELGIQPIREIDQNTPITVGYNHYYIGFPVHEKLDFVNNHFYPCVWSREFTPLARA